MDVQLSRHRWESNKPLWSAFGVDALIAGNPTSQQPPGRIVTFGNLLVEGKGAEPENLQRAPPLTAPLPIERWQILTQHAHNGWVQIQDFIAAYKTHKRL